MTSLLDLKPIQRHHVFDLVDQAGFDVGDWIASSNDPRGPKANPKYCYEWSFIEPDRLIILNLWHPAMVEEAGRIVIRDNFRSEAEFHRTINRKPSWAKRAQKLDDALQTALKDNLPVRVIVIDGVRRSVDDPERRPSKVNARELDPEPWTITAYDWGTGQFELTRGIFAREYVDQFDLDLADKAGPDRIDISTSAFVRDPAVRRRVLTRSRGRCELCGQLGFKMTNGALYLETHHIKRLADGGTDADTNVVALCANDHKRAHFAEDRGEIAERLLAYIGQLRLRKK